ncbi:unnamed protein product [marine sediment metagenome]|uniref:Uncharacterized protein n=1 Tax=marine sediment metagenome TaxID=412755 RepID=X1AP89_9ZZZZ
MVALNWILIGILIAVGLFEALLIITGKKTITQGMGIYNFTLPGWLNLTIIIGLGVFQYFLYVKWNVRIHPFIVATYNLIFGHLFGRF